jgi:hypothetical protein
MDISIPVETIHRNIGTDFFLVHKQKIDLSRFFLTLCVMNVPGILGLCRATASFLIARS